ncbi:hypothetical protein NL676_008035 [Syzygium grande]|nr:hypothetical protein NL676_008035 [Syzygium grande]
MGLAQINYFHVIKTPDFAPPSSLPSSFVVFFSITLALEPPPPPPNRSSDHHRRLRFPFPFPFAGSASEDRAELDPTSQSSSSLDDPLISKSPLDTAKEKLGFGAPSPCLARHLAARRRRRNRSRI